MKDRVYTIYRRHRFSASIALSFVLFIVACMMLVLSGGQSIKPTDLHMVSVRADEQTTNYPTRAATVGEFIEKNHIYVGAQDAVEPARETVISSDDFKIQITRAKSYVVYDGDMVVASISAHDVPRLVAQAAGIELRPADTVSFAPEADFSSDYIGRRVEIVRAKLVNLSLYGKQTQVYSNAATVKDFLAELATTPAADDELSLSIDTKLTDGMALALNRKGIRVVTEEVAIPADVQYVSDSSLSFGSTSVRDPGADGKKTVTYEVAVENDVEISRREISSSIIEQPRTKVIARGTTVAAAVYAGDHATMMALAGISADEYGAVDYIISRESGWCATKWQGSYGYCPDFYEEKYPGAESNTSLGYGLCQSTPAQKMASAGADWRTNAVTQLIWCTGYARGRYGSWTAAYEWWVEHHWW